MKKRAWKKEAVKSANRVDLMGKLCACGGNKPELHKHRFFRHLDISDTDIPAVRCLDCDDCTEFRPVPEKKGWRPKKVKLAEFLDRK